MFYNIEFSREKPKYKQIYDHIKEMILAGILAENSKLPSTRELAKILKVSRNTVNSAYELLEEEHLVYFEESKGTFVSQIEHKAMNEWNIQWDKTLNDYALQAEKFDIMKTELTYNKQMISFNSIAPDETLFNIDELKRCFLDIMAMEGEKIVNYGYAKGFKGLIDYLFYYMEQKGVNCKNKSILISNGFTEGLDIVLSAITNPGDTVICENPTHNTALKIMRLHNLDILGIAMKHDGMDLQSLGDHLKKYNVKLGFLIPSYHNPTGVVMSYKKRKVIYQLFKENEVPIIEDGFNEELQLSGAHMAPLAAIGQQDNGVIYIGSFSKILFPGMRTGWVFADTCFIDSLVSIKRSRNIHTSTLDQAVLAQYLKSGYFDKYVKKVRRSYREKYEFITGCIKNYIPKAKIMGNGGNYIFLKIKDITARELLARCYKRGVIFTPADVFYVNKKNTEWDTFRLGYSRLSKESIKQGVLIIGEEVAAMLKILDKNDY